MYQYSYKSVFPQIEKTARLFNLNPCYNNNYFRPNENFSNFMNYNVFQNKYNNNIQKRTYNDLLDYYKEKQNINFNVENEERNKALKLNNRNNLNKIDYIHHKNNTKDKLIINNGLKNKKKEIKFDYKKYNDDIDIVEQNFNKKKINLSKSYLIDDELKLNSDLEDTKETSICLNLSFDYPEVNMDNSIKNKLITNAIELEKTFNRFFNVKNMPNKR